LQLAAIIGCTPKGVIPIISVDWWHPRIEATLRARDLGVDLIITDHHEPDGNAVAGAAVINPKRADCTYPDKNPRASASLKLVQALRQRADRTKAAGLREDCRSERWPTWCRSSARTASSQSLASAAQSRAAHGRLRALSRRRPTGKTIDSHQVGFILAPARQRRRRMSTPDIATRLLLANDESAIEDARRSRSS
jgi:single-stranded-DNA-specific exonuclease